jgi:hypothetical protein
MYQLEKPNRVILFNQEKIMKFKSAVNTENRTNSHGETSETSLRGIVSASIPYLSVAALATIIITTVVKTVVEVKNLRNIRKAFAEADKI